MLSFIKKKKINDVEKLSFAKQANNKYKCLEIYKAFQISFKKMFKEFFIWINFDVSILKDSNVFLKWIILR